MSITYVTCVQEGEFEPLLTSGRKYPIIAIYDEKKQLYTQADNGKRRWFPFHCFSLTGEEVPAFEEIAIHEIVSGPIEQSLEARILFPGGECRHCWFATPRQLARHSELIEGTEIWVHYENRNLILIGTLSEETARQAIHHIHTYGDLLSCTLPLASGSGLSVGL